MKEMRGDWRAGMMKKYPKQMSESMLMGVLLTLAGGFQDAYSYICRDRVFANAQTGNLVLLGKNLAEGNLSAALRYFFPLAAFAGGIFLAGWVRQLSRNRRLHWRQTILLAEIALLLTAGLLPQQFNILANVMLSFSCAMQVESFRKFGGLTFATTMCIGNMRNATSLMCQYHITRDPARKRESLTYYCILVVFGVGAALGALLSERLGDRSIWIAAGLMLAGFLLMFRKPAEEC